MHGFGSAGAQVGFQRQVEVGRIHADEDIGRFSNKALAQLTADAHNFTVAADQFPAETVHRQLVLRPPGLHTASDHLRAAYSAHLQRTPARLHTLDQSTSQQVA